MSTFLSLPLEAGEYMFVIDEVLHLLGAATTKCEQISGVRYENLSVELVH